MKRILIELAAVALIGALGAMSATASTLEEVKARGHVNCGTSAGYLGFSNGPGLFQRRQGRRLAWV